MFAYFTNKNNQPLPNIKSTTPQNQISRYEPYSFTASRHLWSFRFGRPVAPSSVCWCLRARIPRLPLPFRPLAIALHSYSVTSQSSFCLSPSSSCRAHSPLRPLRYPFYLATSTGGLRVFYLLLPALHSPVVLAVLRAFVFRTASSYLGSLV